jgi:hypothetical protein
MEGIVIKVNGLSQRLESIEKVIWASVTKKHTASEHSPATHAWHDEATGTLPKRNTS